MEYLDVPDPTPGPGEAVVDVQAIGVNFTDIYTRMGVNPPASLPWVLGLEAAGIVSSVGDGVSEVSVGDLVAYSSIPGSYAEKVAAPADKLIKMPDGVDAEAGAAIMLQGMTAHYLANSTYPIQAGDTVLVHAGAGGVGLILTQMAKTLGATVITTVSTQAKADLSREFGADHVINYTTQDFEQEVMRITNNEGLPVVYDSVGATTFDKSIACLKVRGYMVLYGQASGPVPPVPVATLNGKGLFLTRPGLGHYSLTRDELVGRANDVLGAVQSGELKLHMHGSFALKDAAEAHNQLAGRATTGKLLLIP